MSTVPAAFQVCRTFSAGKDIGRQSSGTWRAQLSCARMPQTSQHDPRCKNRSSDSDAQHQILQRLTNTRSLLVQQGLLLRNFAWAADFEQASECLPETDCWAQHVQSTQHTAEVLKSHSLLVGNKHGVPEGSGKGLLYALQQHQQMLLLP